ncbi:LytTR family DNA-binding domain-containing protein [Formosa algae]|uniref:LytTR family DNA-binding domain-containing protein n=1 Tax=Formosa algae TaxID=225843 RepID=UPI000CCE4805|nr:LytTR family DNA-binding domain-containing protein [Formosa algae]PNW26442.1 hypothetical protein BKP44_17095 [Formosa algae]
MTFNTPFPYNASFKIHIIIGGILGLLLSFILITLQPFNLNNFNHKYGDVLLLGFGLVKFLNYTIAHFVENYFYKLHKKWTLWNEIIFLILSSLTGAILGYIYLDLVFENQPLSFLRLILFLYYIVLPILPLLIFPKSVLRYLIIKSRIKDFNTNNNENTETKNIASEKIILTGQSVNDKLMIFKEQLVYVKSIDNYVKVYYSDEKLKSKMLRASLSEILNQAPFLIKPHRSYLINPEHAYKIEGNSQKAVLVLKNLNEDIPISRTAYKDMKAVFH